MARVLTQNSTNVTGRIGEVVYVRYKGGTYVRKAAKKRRDASSPKMLLNQHRFKQISQFCARFKHTLIPRVWNDAATTGSGYNLFMKSNSAAFAPDGSLPYPSLLQLSVGKLLLPKLLIAEQMAPNSNTIQVKWEKETHILGTRLRDDLMVISGHGLQFSEMTPTGLKRKDLQGTFELPGMDRPAEHIYLFFASEDRRGFSQSQAFKI